MGARDAGNINFLPVQIICTGIQTVFKEESKMLNVTESERQEFRGTYRKMSESIVEFCKDYKSSNLLILRKSILRMQAIIKVLDAKIDSIENRAEYEALDVYTSRLDDIIAIHIDMFGFDNLYALAVDIAKEYNKFYFSVETAG